MCMFCNCQISCDVCRTRSNMQAESLYLDLLASVVVHIVEYVPGTFEITIQSNSQFSEYTRRTFLVCSGSRSFPFCSLTYDPILIQYAWCRPNPQRPMFVVVQIPWGEFVRSPPVWAVICTHFCNNWGYYTLLAWLPSYFEGGLGQDLSASTYLSLLPYLAMVRQSQGTNCLGNMQMLPCCLIGRVILKYLAQPYCGFDFDKVHPGLKFSIALLYYHFCLRWMSCRISMAEILLNRSSDCNN